MFHHFPFDIFQGPANYFDAGPFLYWDVGTGNGIGTFGRDPDKCFHLGFRDLQYRMCLAVNQEPPLDFACVHEIQGPFLTGMEENQRVVGGRDEASDSKLLEPQGNLLPLPPPCDEGEPADMLSGVHAVTKVVIFSYLCDMSDVLNEITPLSEKDFFYIVERHKTEFTYPVHQHKEFELNFIEGGAGVRRIVGDSVETIGDYDLVLVGGDDLEHVWEQGDCQSKDIREITIQFPRDMFSPEQLAKNQFAAIRRMLQQAEHGLAFPVSSIMKVYHILDTLPSQKDRFRQFLQFLLLLNELASSEDARVLASTSFAHAAKSSESRRILKVKQYIDEHYTETVHLADLADMVGMSPSAFSRFFKLRTGRTLSDYLIDIKLGNAARLLVDTAQNISEICYECGFNNLSNFNRIFKAKRGVTPREFRALYKKNKVIV